MVPDCSALPFYLTTGVAAPVRATPTSAKTGLVHYCSLQQRGYPGIPIAEYTRASARMWRESLTAKSCAPNCTIGCVHRISCRLTTSPGARKRGHGCAGRAGTGEDTGKLEGPWIVVRDVAGMHRRHQKRAQSPRQLCHNVYALNCGSKSDRQMPESSTPSPSKGVFHRGPVDHNQYLINRLQILTGYQTVNTTPAFRPVSRHFWGVFAPANPDFA